MRTNVCNESAYGVQAAHTQALPASMLFGKTCLSCLLGQIPGQAARPAGETRESWKDSTLSVLSPRKQ